MALRKYASLEQAQVLSLKGTKERARTANLDKIAEFTDYRTEDGFLYARIRAISSRVNKNHDGWPSVELAGDKEIFDRHVASESGFTVEAKKDAKYGFATFLGKPIFVDHNNSNPDRARGVVVDAKLHVEDHKTASELDPYYASAPDEHMPPTWVELLLEVDAKSFPKLAKAIIEGSKDPKKGIDGFSMGCDVEKSVCNICKNAATAPDEYCKHVKLKGAEFDWINPKNGRKESKKSYEDCYGVKFFEISAVFDPADETALLREVKASVQNEAMHKHAPEKGDDEYFGDASKTLKALKEQYGEEKGEEVYYRMRNKKRKERGETKDSFTKTAENPPPQADMMTAPEYVDTLREEEICPVCGSTMDQGHQCDVCGYVAPPDGLDNPDLDAAQQQNALQDPQEADPMEPQAAEDVNAQNHPSSPPAAEPRNTPVAASVNSEKMAWQIHHPKLAGQINPVERPIQADPRPATNEPQEKIISDQTKPVTNRTAASMIAAVNKENHMGNRKTAADAPTQDTKADKRVDVKGVGGMMDSNNESASKADTQTNVEGRGGIHEDSNQSASAPDRQESLPTADESADDAGYNKDKPVKDSGPTKTWDNSNEPDSAVTQKAFPTARQHAAGDAEPFPKDDGGVAGGSATQGTQPADPVGKAQDRVDVLDATTSPENNSGPTTTWSGTDGNGVTKQQSPVTRDSLEGEDLVNLKGSSFVNVVELLKIADTEVELGLIEASQKYERIAELEKEGPDSIRATAQVLARVRTAGLRKNASTGRGVGRVPSFRHATRRETVTPDNADESLFM